MKTAFSSTLESNKAPVANPFDAIKFARLIRYKDTPEKDHRHWFQRFRLWKNEQSSSSFREVYKTY
jgi:hypothetical protein